MARCSPIKIFLFLDFLTPWFLATSFLFGHVSPWKRWDYCCEIGPACHPLCTIKVSFPGLFLAPDISHLPFSFDLMPTLKCWDRCCKMGPACHPLCTIKNFLGLFLAPDIWSLAFFFQSHAAFETLRNLLDHGTRMSSSMYNKSFLFWSYISSSDFWLFPFPIVFLAN
jgi:hypothetical protein